MDKASPFTGMLVSGWNMKKAELNEPIQAVLGHCVDLELVVAISSPTSKRSTPERRHMNGLSAKMFCGMAPTLLRGLALNSYFVASPNN